MAQQIKVLIAKPDELSLIPKTHIMEERTNYHRLSPDLHIHAKACVCVCVVVK